MRESSFSIQNGNKTLVYETIFEKVSQKCLFFNLSSGAILGDDMGLGKTIQTVAFLSAVISGIKQSHALIVVPASVQSHWMDQIQKFSLLKFVQFSSKKKVNLAQFEGNRSDILLISYDLLRLNFEAINRIKWECVVFDEVHVKDTGAFMNPIFFNVFSPKEN